MSSNNLFAGLTEFVEVVECNGFAAAAVKLGRSASYVSKEISRLEKRLGVRLLNRTTRRIGLTESGRAYFERCRQLLFDAEAAEALLGEFQETPRGLLRVSAPVSFGQAHLSELLPEFIDSWPGVRLDIEYNERIVDIVAEGIDVAIRVGALRDSRLVAKKLMSSRGVIVAAPCYLASKGTPRHPADLGNHDCIGFSLAPLPTRWDITRADGKRAGVDIEARVICNSAELELSLAIAGIGIARLPLFVCQAALARGQLTALFDDYRDTEMDVYAIYPHRQFLSAKVRAFVDFLRDRLTAAVLPV